MSDIKINSQNQVRARGRVIAIKRDNYGHRSVLLFIRGSRDIRPLYVSFALGTDLPLEVTAQSFVKIEGHVTAYSYRNEVWGRQSYVQYFVADKISLDETQLEKAFPEECANKGFARQNPFVDVALMGEVARISRSEAQTQEGTDKPRVWTRIMLKVDPVEGETRPSYVNVQYSSNMRVSDVPIAVGDKVCLTAIVFSKRKNINGEESPGRGTRQASRTFEDIIVNDLVVIEPAPDADPKEIEKALAAEQTAPAETKEEGSFFEDSGDEE